MVKQKMVKQEDVRVIYRHIQTTETDYGGDCSPVKSEATGGPFGEWPRCLNFKRASFLLDFGYEKKKCHCGNHTLFRTSIPGFKVVMVIR